MRQMYVHVNNELIFVEIEQYNYLFGRIMYYSTWNNVLFLHRHIVYLFAKKIIIYSNSLIIWTDDLAIWTHELDIYADDFV